MRCPHCDKEYETNTIFCPGCGTWVLGSMYISSVESTLPEESDRDSDEMRQKLRRFSILAACGALLLTVLVGFWLFWPEKAEPYIKQQGSYYLYNPAGQNILLYNGKHLADVNLYTNMTYSTFTSLDGRTVLLKPIVSSSFLLHDGQLILQEELQTLAVAASGNGLVYVAEGTVLYHFDVQSQTRTKISDAYYGKAVISPDGKGVAFITRMEDALALQYYRDGETVTVCQDLQDYEIMALSDSGEQFYICDGEHWACCNQNGEITILGNVGPYQSLNSPKYPNQYFNADHSQMVFTDGEKTWISENGQEAQVYCEGLARPLYAAGTASVFMAYHYGLSLTCPVYDLKELVFCEQIMQVDSMLSSGLWGTLRLWRDDQILLENGRNPWMDASGSILYYLDENQNLMRLDISKKDSQPKIIAEKVLDFFVSPDGSQVTYCVEQTLYCCNGMGRRVRKIAEAFTGTVYYSQDSIPYCLQSQNLYAIMDKEMVVLLEDVTTVSAQLDGTLYIITKDGNLYMSAPGGTIKPLVATQSGTEDTNTPG